MSITKTQLEEVNLLRENKFTTLRPISEDLEKILYQIFPVLDHGFIRVVDYMGNDSSIVQAARVSYGKGTKKLNEDRGLINYLMRHRHTTPFEMCDIKFHIKLPIFIARQWIRHRTASINEYSARYSVLEDEFYIPAPKNIAAQSKKNHQGRDEDKRLSHEEQNRILEILKTDSRNGYNHYLEMMNEDKNGNIIDESKDGVARELARMNLSLNCYTEWYWKINLHNLFHFLALRADSHAQYEIREYANIMLDMVQKWVPHAYAAFEKYRMGGKEFSRDEINLIKQLIKGNKVTQENSNLSKREWGELKELLGF
jgi:thymidylate synthase (FAD)